MDKLFRDRDFIAEMHAHTEHYCAKVPKEARAPELQALVESVAEAWKTISFNPDHNGECLNCDEGADAHEPGGLCRGLDLGLS